MVETISWNLDIALNITCSLREFISFEPCENSQKLDNTLNSLDRFSNWNSNMKYEVYQKLCLVLDKNNWIISCRNSELISLRCREKFFCAKNQILIIKGYSEVKISAIESEGSRSYFLVAALSASGKSLINWKKGLWNSDLETAYIPNEPYYFYYCKTSSERIHKYLRFQYYPTTYQRNYRVLWNIWKNSQKPENTIEYQFSFNELSSRDFREEANQKEEIIKKLRGENEENKSIIERLESRIKELKGNLISNEMYHNHINQLQKSNEDLKSEKELLINENQELKTKINTLISNYEKEKKELNQSSTKAAKMRNGDFIDKETQKKLLEEEINNLEETLSQKKKLLFGIREPKKLVDGWPKSYSQTDNINYPQIHYNKENEIIRLPPNTKHGLPNFGNTCYLNSLLQIFASTPQFKAKIKNISTPFCSSLSSLLSNMQIESSSITVRNLAQNFYQNLISTYSNIEQYSQQDVKEIFNMILSKIEEDGGNLDIFSITFHQTFTCNRYFQHTSEYNDIQTFLIIPPQHKDSLLDYIMSQAFHPMTTQPLFCNNCNAIVNTTIRLKSTDWPTYLVLYFPSPPNNIKETIYIDYDNMYELYGAICYYQDGGSLHYTAFTKDGQGWNEYNDEHVETRSITSNVVNLAFYAKKRNFSLI